MKLHINKDTAPLLLPPECLDVLADADTADLRVLLYLAGCEADQKEFDAAEAADALLLSESEVRSSLKFWKGAGLVKSAGKKAAEPSAEQKPLRSKRKTKLNTEEILKVTEKNADFKPLLDMAQQTAGWIFNPGEIEIIARLYSELRLSGEYILAMIGYFVCRREKSIPYLEQVCYDYAVKKGIATAEALEERLRWLERFEGRAGRIRAMFGIGARDLTADEESILTAWFDTYAFDDDVIRLAYEKTVKQIGKASIAYAGKILTDWHAKGIKTVEDAKNASKKPTKKQSFTAGAKENIATQSFNVDDAFQKALERSYGEKKQ